MGVERHHCHVLYRTLFIYLFIATHFLTLTTHPSAIYLLDSLPHHQTQHDGRFYELKIHCPESYPASPPEVRFVSKINMNCVDGKTGKVINKKLPCMRSWNRNMGIEQVLVALRQEMTSSENRKLKQPMEGSTF